MSSPEVEKFEVTEDDLLNEFLPKRGRRQTKNQATYGIWADYDSDDDRPGFGGKKKVDMTFPVNFVSGGIKRGDKTTKEDGSSSDSDTVPEKPQRTYPKSAQNRGQRSKPYFGSGLSDRTEKGFGDWEKHTRGIGQKLLSKMGYEPGKGLGKKGQGITTPVEAVKRKGFRATIGYHGTERTERSLKDFPVRDSEDEEEKEFQAELQQWKKQGEAVKKKPKYNYKTAQELIDAGGKKRKPLTSEAAKVKVIDMTGKEQKVLSGYHAIAHRHDKPEEEEEYVPQITPQKRAFDMPELLHNLDILVDLAEDEIIQNDRRLKHERDLIVNLRHEQERLDEICEREVTEIDKLKRVLDIVESFETRTKPDCENPLTLEDCVKIFHDLQEDLFVEYKMYDLSALAIATVFPMMKTFLSQWDPLKDPQCGFDIMKEWKGLLEDPSHNYSQEQENMDVYHRLIWDVWLPVVRSTILRWNVRLCDPLIELLETWMPILPPWIMTNIQDQLVLPRLLQEVENWNPLTDTMPIHAWLHPWLPLMAEKLEPLYSPIRHKLGNALTNWHPSDGSAKVILQPWVPVFKPGHMQAFLVKHILPKLARCMQEFPINPLHQTLDAWKWVMSWSDLIPVNQMVAMLESTFFPKWLQVLMSWLGNMPNYDEITKWYLGWKSLFGEQLVSHPLVKEQLNKALEIMNRVVTGHMQPGVKENIAYFAHAERRQMDIQPPPPQEPPLPPERRIYENPALRTGGSTYPSSFRELVERKAADNNILFMPLQGKTYEAKQIYRFGKVMVYIDRNVVFILEKGAWQPISLSNLVERGKG